MTMQITKAHENIVRVQHSIKAFLMPKISLLCFLLEKVFFMFGNLSFSLIRKIQYMSSLIYLIFLILVPRWFSWWFCMNVFLRMTPKMDQMTSLQQQHQREERLMTMIVNGLSLALDHLGNVF